MKRLTLIFRAYVLPWLKIPMIFPLILGVYFAAVGTLVMVTATPQHPDHTGPLVFYGMAALCLVAFVILGIALG